MSRSVLSLVLAVLYAACTAEDHGGRRRGDNDALASCRPDYSSRAADPAAAEAFCDQGTLALCERFFDGCSSAVFHDHMGWDGESDCINARFGAQYSQTCYLELYDRRSFDPALADACLGWLQTVSCTTLYAVTSEDDLDPSCQDVFGPVAPPTAECRTIGAGTVGDSLDQGDPSWGSSGGPCRSFCLCLDAAQVLTAATAAQAGSSLDDTIVYLFGPDGAELARDDDGGSDAGFSLLAAQPIPSAGPHLLLVCGGGPDQVGAFLLTVTLE